MSPMLLLLLLRLPSSLQRCVFDEVQARVRVVRSAPSDARDPLTSEQRSLRAAGSLRKRSMLGEKTQPPQPIRIQSWLSGQSDGLSEAERGRLDAAVQEAVRTVSSLLSVTRVGGFLRLSRDVNKYCKFLWKNSSSLNHNRCGRANSNYRAETCLEVIIPDDHLDGCDIYPQPDSPHKLVLRPAGAGLPNADFLLYVLVQATDKCRAEVDVLAYAVHCRTDPRGRPLAGVVVVCRETLRGGGYHHATVVQTVIHELLHALGFSKDLFSSWRRCSERDAAGCPPGRPPGRPATRPDASGQTRLFSPAVVSALQAHLQSADPGLGAPLENQGAPPGGASSHWEARVLQGSIMAAALGDWATVRLDRVTLAALQDTGWYRVDLSRAQTLLWGHGEGSTFGSVLTCNSSPFFCTGSGLGCHFLHLHKGACQTDRYLEGCRMFKPLSNRSECFRKENSRFPDDGLRGEVFGPDSRCFFSSLIRSPQSGGPGGSVEGLCYRHSCTGPNRFQIQVSGSGWLHCPAGGSIQVDGYQGAVFCPDRRLCLHGDVPPLPDDTNPSSSSSSSSNTSLGSGTSSTPGTWSPPGPPAVASAVCVSAAVVLLAALAASSRHRGSCRVRGHAVAPQHRSDR